MAFSSSSPPLFRCPEKAEAQAPVVKALEALGQENEEALRKDPEDPLYVHLAFSSSTSTYSSWKLPSLCRSHQSFSSPISHPCHVFLLL